MDYLKKHYSFLDILMLLAIVFIGSDIYGFQIAGMNFRFVQVYYVLIALFLMFNHKYRILIPKSLVVFCAFFVIASILSINISKSVFFNIWLFYNIVFVFGLFYTYIKLTGKEKFINIFRLSLFIIFILASISFLFGNILKIEFPFFTYQNYKGINRTALWFYEPSYLASFVTIHLGFSFYKFFVHAEKKYIYDVIFSILTILFTTSSTGFIAILLCLVFAYIYKALNMSTLRKKIYTLLIGLSIIICLFLIVYFAFPKIYNVFIKRLFVDGLSSSSGNRVSGYADAIKAFIKYPLFGVGPNCYGLYLGNSEIQPTNVTLELLATTGIFATCAFYFFALYPIKTFIFKNKYNDAKPFTFALITFILILQANQNYMRLYMWMIIGISYAYMRLENEEREVINDGCLHNND